MKQINKKRLYLNLSFIGLLFFIICPLAESSESFTVIKDVSKKQSTSIEKNILFKVQIKRALKNVDTEGLIYKNEIAKIYSEIAKEAETELGWTLFWMLSEARIRNGKVLNTELKREKWKYFWIGLSNSFKSLKLSPDDLEGHIRAFKDVAEILSTN